MCPDQQRRVDGEQLADLAALDDYLDGLGWTGRRDHDAAELAAVHRLRERLGRSGPLPATRSASVGQVNALLSDTRASPWLTRHAEMPEWHLHLASDPRSAVAAHGRRDGDGASRPHPRRASCAGSRPVQRRTATPRWSTCRATGRASSATRETAVTASTSRPTASAAQGASSPRAAGRDRGTRSSVSVCGLRPDGGHSPLVRNASR